MTAHYRPLAAWSFGTVVVLALILLPPTLFALGVFGIVGGAAMTLAVRSHRLSVENAGLWARVDELETEVAVQVARNRWLNNESMHLHLKLTEAERGNVVPIRREASDFDWPEFDRLCLERLDEQMGDGA